MERDRLSDYLDNLVEMSRTIDGRFLAISGGALFAGTYLGMSGADVLGALQAGIIFMQSKLAYLSPTVISSDFFNGAQFFCMGAIDSALEAIPRAGHDFALDLVNAIREASRTAREDFSISAEISRTLFNDVAKTVGGKIETLANATKDLAAKAVENGPKIAQVAFDVVKGAVEAYGFYEVGKKIYNHWFKRAKDDVETVIGEKAPAETVNITVNVAMTGAELGHDDQEISDRIGEKISSAVSTSFRDAQKAWEASGRAIKFPSLATTSAAKAEAEKSADLLKGDLNLLNHVAHKVPEPGMRAGSIEGYIPDSFGGAPTLEKLEAFKRSSRQLDLLQDNMLEAEGIKLRSPLDPFEDVHIPEKERETHNECANLSPMDV
jgi:hypothetical protein